MSPVAFAITSSIVAPRNFSFFAGRITETFAISYDPPKNIWDTHRRDLADTGGGVDADGLAETDALGERLGEMDGLEDDDGDTDADGL
jgi:hypothetical protein